MKAIEKFSQAVKGRFDNTETQNSIAKLAYIAESEAWKVEVDGNVSSYNTSYSGDMANRYGEEADEISNYESTVTTNVNLLIDNPELDTDLKGIADELESDKAAVNAAVAASIAAELAQRDEFRTNFGEVSDFDIAVNHDYTVTGI